MLHIVLFYTFAICMLGAAAGVVFSRNPVHSVMYLVLTFFQSALLWLMAEAEFLAIVLVLVYVGAVLVLFLFVIMLLDIPVKKKSNNKLYLLFSTITSLIMFAELYMIIFYHDFSDKVMSNVASELNNTYEIGLMLFTQHIFSFEVTAFILLVAIIAAIAINLTLRERSLRQDPGKQILENKESRLKIIKGDEL